MSTPFIAGVAALILEAKGRTAATALDVLSLLQNAAQPIPESKNVSALLTTLGQAGAGLVDAYSVIHTTTIATPGQPLLNDTANFKGAQTVIIKNVGTDSLTYFMDHEAALTIDTFNGTEAYEDPLPTSQSAAAVRFSTASFTLAPGQTREITVCFTPPQIANSTLPVYTGYLRVKTADGKVVARVSYLGIVGSLRERKVIDTSDRYFGIKTPVLIDADLQVQHGPRNYTLQGNDTPTLVFR